MNEGQTNIPDSELVVYHLLPTTDAIARQGAKEYQAVITSLKVRELKKLFTTDPATARCFIGTEPVSSFNFQTYYFDSTIESMRELEKSFPGNIKMLSILESDKSKSIHGYYLCNLTAVEIVMSNYPQYFPIGYSASEYLTTFKRYKYNNRGSDQIIENGLLSGFPLQSVLDFIKYSQITEKIDTSLISTTRDTDFFYGYFQKERSEIEKNKMRKILEQTFSLSEDEITHYLKRRTQTAPQRIQSFISFHESDDKYIADIDQIYLGSGVDMK